jgi:hypothetical protein
MIGEFTFTPSLCDGVSYSGSISIRPLSFDERLDLYEEFGEGGDEENKTKFALGVMRKVGKKSHEFVTKCDVLRVEDGHKYTWDEVYHDGALTPLVVEVCNKIVGKIAAGI